MSRETNRFWWNRFGPIFAAGIRKKRKDRMRALSGCRWHLDEVFVKINGERHYLWRAVDQEAHNGPCHCPVGVYPSLTSGTGR